MSQQPQQPGEQPKARPEDEYGYLYGGPNASYPAPGTPPQQPAPYGAGYGEPYPPYPGAEHTQPYPQVPGQQPGYAYGPAFAQPGYPAAGGGHRKRGHLRWLAAGVAGALVFAVGGFGIGYAVHDGSGSQSQALTQNGNGSSPFQGFSGNGQGSEGGQGGYGGYGGYGQQGGQFGQFGQFGQNGYGGQSGNTGTTSAATSTQIKGLVRIHTILGYQDGEAAGTGMVVNSDGEVITNHHVVAGATKITATVMSTGKTYTAKVVGTDATDDVAVVQLSDASGLSTVKTDTSTVKVGDKVTAVGDANGDANTFTAAPGKVVALNQKVTTQSTAGEQGESLTGMIQISSDVISGDSGGPTYDSDGEVVGMTTAASMGGTDTEGFAIPISRVLSVADNLENHVSNSQYAYGTPAFLGIGLSEQGTAPTVAQVFDGTAAAKAGIAQGDTITKVGGTSVGTAAQLQKAIAGYSPGDSVAISWHDTAGKSHTATVTLGSGPIK